MIVNGNYSCETCGESFDTNVKIAAHVRNHKHSIDPEYIRSELDRISEELGRSPKQDEVGEMTDFTKGAVASNFGSWRAGLAAIGREPLNYTYTKSDIVAELRRVANLLGHSPSSTEMAESGTISPNTVRQHYGSWNRGLECAGLSTTHSSKISNEEAISAIVRLAERLRRPPSANEMDEHGEISAGVAQRCFGTWNRALKESGFDPNVIRNIPERLLNKAVDDLAEVLGHTPSSKEMEKYGRFSAGPYFKRHGTWEDAMEAAGHEYRSYPTGPGHPSWKGGCGDVSYGTNWRRQRKSALQRDGFVCQMPGCDIDRERHQELFSSDLSVHHIVPLHSFMDEDGNVDYEQANSVNNLATVCRRHHPYWEQLSPLRPDIR